MYKHTYVLHRHLRMCTGAHTCKNSKYVFIYIPGFTVFENDILYYTCKKYQYLCVCAYAEMPFWVVSWLTLPSPAREESTTDICHDEAMGGHGDEACHVSVPRAG